MTALVAKGGPSLHRIFNNETQQEIMGEGIAASGH
jgi:hypothetical protein